jgi:hypothetical protein
MTRLSTKPNPNPRINK